VAPPPNAEHPAKPHSGTKLLAIPNFCKYCLIYIRVESEQLVSTSAFLWFGMSLPWPSEVLRFQQLAALFGLDFCCVPRCSLHLSWYHEGRQENIAPMVAPNGTNLLQASLLLTFDYRTAAQLCLASPVCPPQAPQFHTLLALGIDHVDPCPNDSVRISQIHDPATLPSMHFWPFNSCWSSEIPSVDHSRQWPD